MIVWAIANWQCKVKISILEIMGTKCLKMFSMEKRRKLKPHFLHKSNFYTNQADL